MNIIVKLKGEISMREKREKVKEIADLLEYKIRSGAVSPEGGDVIWRIALKNPEKVDAIVNILDMELPEAETVAKVEKLV